MRKSFVLLSALLTVFLVSCGQSEQPVTKSKPSESAYLQSSTPTVFFHGYSGGKGSFGSMLKRLEGNHLTKKELVLTVEADGAVEQEGTWHKEQKNPTVQVLFENNKSTQENQSRWIRNVLAFLHTTYEVNEVNIVGHSMGSVSTVTYLERYTQVKDQPKVKRVVLIAGPFNEFLDTFPSQSQADLLQNGPSTRSERYQTYVEEAKDIPKDIQFQVISGKLSEKKQTDGRVPLSSSLAIVPILDKQGMVVSSKIIVGKQAQHSKLHENPKVDEVIRQFLWGN